MGGVVRGWKRNRRQPVDSACRTRTKATYSPSPRGKSLGLSPVPLLGRSSLLLHLQPNREESSFRLEPKRELRAAASVSRSKLPLREDLHLCLALRAHRSLQLRFQPNKKGDEKGTRRLACALFVGSPCWARTKARTSSRRWRLS